MRKLLSLLRKDAILVRRNKIWTAFELLVPVLLLIAPIFVIKEESLLAYKVMFETTNSMRALAGKIEEIDLLDPGPLELQSVTCMPPPIIDLKIYDYSNQTNQNDTEFIEKVRESEKKCAPIGGILLKPEGVVLIAPVPYHSLLKKPIVIDTVEEEKPSSNTISVQVKNMKKEKKKSSNIFATFAPYLYREMSNVFWKQAQNTVLDHDELHAYYIFDTFKDTQESFFKNFSFFLSVCLTLPVMNTVRSIVAEKATIQPYLHSIGLSSVLFYTVHYLFAVIKSSVLPVLACVAYCIVYPHFNAFWLLMGVFFYITTCISISMFVAAFFTTPRRGLEGIVIVWICLGLLENFGPSSPKGFWHFIQCLNINQNVKLYFLAMEPHFVQDNGMDFLDGFTEARENLYACYVYLSIMIAETVILARLSIDMSSTADKISNFIVKIFWKRRKHIESTNRPSEAELDAILLGEEVVEGRKDAISDIELDNLIKVYSNGEMAVSGLSMRAIRGQVSVLLGHNGCGKSTTFGMITGILEPTEGTISIEGVDAVENRELARESIGYCPQFNPLYEKLTVMEHLKLVNELKGGDLEAFEEDAEQLLGQIGLTEKKDVLAKNLSGGMKRKLCVCMAMIGGSRVVLLDEPTAGMDPGARLDVQNMLEKVKRERTILLTTHYMDEAEKLGDWIFVMSHGRMATSGSIHYLKKRFGDGYIMTLVLEPDQNMQEALPVLDQVFTAYVEDSEIKEQRGQIIEISLPEQSKEEFLPLFEAIEAIIDKDFTSPKLDQLSGELLETLKSINIVATGLSMSSLEQVFIKIGRGCDYAMYGVDDEAKRARAEADFHDLVEVKKEPRLEGNELYALQYSALLYKRFIHLYHNVDQMIFQFFIPLIVFIILATHKWKDTFDPSVVYKSSSLARFPASKVLLQFEGPVDRRIEDYLFPYEHLHLEHIGFDVNVTSLIKNQTANDQKIGLVITSYLNRTVIHYYEKTIDCLPIALNLLTNLKFLRIDPTHPVGKYRIGMMLVPVDGSEQALMLIVWDIFRLGVGGLMLSYAIQPAIMFLVEEKMSKFLHQQLLSGISQWVFWSGNVFWDLLMYLVVSLYGLFWYIGYDVFAEYFYLVFPTFLFYFFANIAFIYLLSVFIKSPTVGSVLLTVQGSTGVIVGFAVMFWGYTMLDVGKTYPYAFYDVSYIMMNAVTKIYISQPSNAVSFSNFRKIPFHFDSIYDFRGVWIDWIYLTLMGVLYFWFFWFLRSPFLKKLMAGRGKATPRPKKKYEFIESISSISIQQPSSTSSNVAVPENTSPDSTVIDVKDLVKDFGKKKRAVNGLTMQVKKRECFGLLGQNGAGKTTTFDMLTGLTVPSGGTATINGEDITNGTEIGYCPQFDAMMEQYSGRQILRIMACLQGYEDYEGVVDLVLSCIGMTKHAGKQVKHCSGGQKRKISVGVALLSRSPCVMLDEPTAGIDPRARREIWDILHCLREKADGSIVLTSHSMEECEALCTRIGVVREGEMIAMGTSQELKSKYGCFYVMTLVLRELETMEEIKAAVVERWNDAYLKSEPTLASLNMVYQLPRSSEDKWSETFMQVEELATELDVEDFMLTQATLEDAFLRLNAN